MQIWSILCLAIIFSDTYLGSLSAESQLPLTRYAIDVERYRFGSSPDRMDPAFYPIPQIKVTLRVSDEPTLDILTKKINAKYADVLVRHVEKLSKNPIEKGLK